MNPIIPSASASVALARLESHGFEAWAVGGCVRDALLGLSPHDWDLTTNAHPNQIAACFTDCRVIETGIRHGTVTVLIDGEPIEITTYRRDGAYTDNRRPEKVTFSQTISEDLSRRDFTVNAMAYHPKRGLVDLFGGQTDLHNGLIRCVGDPRTRFGEDGLRILRALRFASVLRFVPEEQTAAQIHACRHLLDHISRERVREEFSKLLCGQHAAGILRDYTDVVLQFLPELAPGVGFAQNSRYHCFDVWEHTLCALNYDESKDLTVRLSILLHDIGKPSCYSEDELGGHFRGHAEAGAQIADSLLRRLCYDNVTRERVCRLVRMHDMPLSSEPHRVKRMLTKLTEQELYALLEIARCDRLAHAPGYNVPSPALSEIPETVRALLAENACLSLKSLALKGDDLIALGIPAGKQLGSILRTLLDAVLDERLPNEKSALIDYVKSNWTVS